MITVSVALWNCGAVAAAQAGDGRGPEVLFAIQLSGGSGIRAVTSSPQNQWTTCPYLGICLDRPSLVEAALARKPGGDLGLFDELVY